MARSVCGHPRSGIWSPEAWFTPGRFALILAVLVFAAFPDVLLGWGTFYYRDFGIFGYPLAHFHRESFWRAETPLWNPYNDCGLPFLAQWNTMVLYPLSLIYLLLPLSWSLGLFCVLHLWLAGLGMYFLARDWTEDRLAASVAGIAFAFNGLTLSCLKWPNNIAAIAWMPIVLLLAERAWRRGGRMILLAAFAGAAQMLTGGPEIILFTWGMIGTLWLVSAFRRGTSATASWPDQGAVLRTQSSLNDPSLPKRFPKMLVRFFAVIILVTGISAAQLLPFLDLLAHSQRGEGYGDDSWAMPKWGWANFLVPLFRCFPSHQGVFAQSGQFWVSSYYAGIGVLLLAVIALLLSRHSRRWLVGAWAAFTLILALGSTGFLYEALRNVLPVLKAVRFPIKFVVIASFCLPLLAAFGIAALGKSANERPAAFNAAEVVMSSNTAFSPVESHIASFRVLWGVGLTCLALIGAIVWFAHSHPYFAEQWATTWRSGVRSGLFAILVLWAVVGLASVQSRQTRSMLGLGLILLLWLDVMSHAPRLNPTIDRDVYEPGLAKDHLKLEPAPRLGHSRAMVSALAEFRLNHMALTNGVDDMLFNRLSLFANANLLDAIPKVDGFFSLYVREEHDVRALLYAKTNASLPGLERFLGVSQITAEDKVIHWKDRTNFMVFATGGQVPIFTDAATTLDALTRLDFDPVRTVYLPAEAEKRSGALKSAEAKVAITRSSAHELELNVDASAPAWIVLAQTFYHPWRAYIDGRPAQLWRANHAFQAVEVPEGRHSVRLNYEDRAFRAGAVISILTLLGCAGRWVTWRGKPI